jgi:hypothetical protein
MKLTHDEAVARVIRARTRAAEPRPRKRVAWHFFMSKHAGKKMTNRVGTVSVRRNDDVIMAPCIFDIDHSIEWAHGED